MPTPNTTSSLGDINLISLLQESGLTAQEVADAIKKSKNSTKPNSTDAEIDASVLKSTDYVTPEMFGSTGKYNILVDDTPFVTAALATGKTVILSNSYTLNGLRLKNGSQLIGLGLNKTKVYQMNDNIPAINCLSDITVGQLLGLNVSNFWVIGRGGTATVSAVLVAAYGAYVVHNSIFNLYITSSYHALEVQGADANNIYMCKFRIVSNNTFHDAILLNGGVYNEFEFCLTGCRKKALGGGVSTNSSIQSSSKYVIACDGQIYISDQSSIFENATIEGLASAEAAAYMFSDTGFNNNWKQPRAICLSSTEGAKVTSGCVFKPFSNTVIDGLRLNTGGFISNPFATNSGYPFTIIGPGQNACPNKLEKIFDGSDRAHNIDIISLIGDVSQFTNKYAKKNKEVLVFKAPTGNLNLQLQRYDSFVIIEPTISPLPELNVSWKVPDETTLKDGHSVTFNITVPVTIMTWGNTPASSNRSLLPTSMANAGTFTIVYSESNNKWYKV